MNRTGPSQSKTTYLISLTLVKVETTEEHELENTRQTVEGEVHDAGGTKHLQHAGSDNEEQQKMGEALQLEAGESIKISAEQDILQSPREDKALFTDGVHPGDRQKSIISPNAENERARESTGITQSYVSRDVPRHFCDVPVRATQRPVSLLKAHGSGRELKESRESIHASSKSLDRKDSRNRIQSPNSPTPGSFRASWAVSEVKPCDEDLKGVVMKRPTERDIIAMRTQSPRAERLKAGSTSLPTPIALISKPQRKGKSRTLDNSDLNCLSEDLLKSKGGQMTSDFRTAQSQGASARDRKMLRFISGIFTKSTPVATSATIVTPIYSSIQRESSEEEASCNNSQEWTLNRSVPELRLGVLGNIRSGKTALVNRFITGSYLPLESHEGGRYKKEVLVEGQSHLLLIREESGPPSAQFCNWLDGVIMVFSLENEGSFQDVYKNYSELSMHRNIAEIPIIAVGTQDKISSTNARVIEDKRVQQLCIDIRRCTYYETCATYGLNVDRVFNEMTQKIAAAKKQAALLASCKSLPNSPSHSGASTPLSGPGQASNGGQSSDYPSSLPSTPVITHKDIRGGASGDGGSQRNPPRRRTSLFANRRGSDSEKRSSDSRGDMSRSVPIKQGTLWKRSERSLNKEWKKKYATLSNSGMLTYHSNINEYMQNAQGKEIALLRVTVKVPGKRLHRAATPSGPSPGPVLVPVPGVNGLSKDKQPEGGATSNLLTVEEAARTGLSFHNDQKVKRCPSSVSNKGFSMDSSTEGATSPPLGKDHMPSSPMTDRKKKKRNRSINLKGDAAAGQAEAKRKMWKLKSFGSLRNINKTEEESADFIIISSTGQSWHFEAQNQEDRDAWVQAIESQILASLQSCESRNKARRTSHSEAVALQAMRNAKGNDLCVDCDAPNPTWASLNLGALICIECSGIHRNLGTHLSRVRSLDLDDWPSELTKVLTAIGNHMANNIWETCTQGRQKLTPDATREQRESWIRAKYEQRAFVSPLPAQCSEGTMSSWLLGAVIDRDLPRLLHLLAHSTKEQINMPPEGAVQQHHSALHAACQLGDVVMTQLLVWYGSDVKSKDPQGRSALTLARQAGSKECAEILLQHGCPSETSPTSPTPNLSRKSSITSLGRANSRRRVS
ncbi:arf-GAP with GTPase, ANK repeat and PH domain-containing protein 2 isoform X1 [Misgurnus anguillicaudatus]|uniref:arf-GAP with GTPase, ANK repeat and PH domain-containing protein 2 isoform X1 n=1 Tax=Misgurnus anguillicaudatus TaxID=75329 RepID=UPI003CCF7909